MGYNKGKNILIQTINQISQVSLIEQKNSQKWAKQGPARPMMRPLANFSFFIFQQLFHFFTLLVPPSSSLFFPRPARSKSFRIRISITDGPTDRPTDQRTRPLIEMWTHLKRDISGWKMAICPQTGVLWNKELKKPDFYTQNHQTFCCCVSGCWVWWKKF